MSGLRLGFVLSFLGAVAWTGRGAELNFDFNDFKPGTPPSGFRSTLSGEGKPGEWIILFDEAVTPLTPVGPDGRNPYKKAVLAKVSRDRTDEHFPMLIYDQEEFGDFTATVRFKLVEGEVEQMAGLAFRIRDERNYYYIRASALSGTFYFFKIVDGQRSAPIGGKTEIKSKVWNELSVQCRGTSIRGFLNGQEVFPELNDATFPSGKLALWTKSDAVVYFSDLHVGFTAHEPLAQILVREALSKYDRLMGLKIVAAAPPSEELKIVASDSADDVGQQGREEERDVIARGMIYQAKGKGIVTLSLPLHDKNGEIVAAVRVIMKRFPGQTEKNALARALPVVKTMESRVYSLKELLE